MIDATTLHRPDPVYLRGLIARSGLTQREVARRLGVEPRTVRRWLTDPPQVQCPYSAQVALETLANGGRE
jgi:transcriptional regulator with XRE-family HTH domain